MALDAPAIFSNPPEHYYCMYCIVHKKRQIQHDKKMYCTYVNIT